MTTEVMEPETSEALIGEVMEAEINEVRELYVPSGLDIFITRIREEVRKHEPDISTERGRKAIASLALKVAKSKVRLDDLGKEVGAEAKLKLDGIQAERKRMRDALDALKDEVRKPLTDWENAEAARQDAHLSALGEIERISFVEVGSSSEEIRGRIAELDVFASRDWQEFQKRYEIGLQAALLPLNRLLSQTVQHEEQLAKIAAFEKSEVERRQTERDAAMKAEAAATAKAAAEAQAARQAQETAQAEAREREAVDRQRVAAEERAAAAEREAVQARENAARAIEEAEAEAKRAAARAAADQAAAVERERARAAEAVRVAAEAEAKREANKKHCAKINRLAVVALMEVDGVTEDIARAIMTAIATGKIPAVKVTY